MKFIMSEHSDSDSKNTITSSDLDREGVCRDFQRGLCERQRCKYKHEKMGNGDGPAVPTLMFCHDFQNNSCPRPACRFIHCSVAEEEQYKRTGELSPHLQLDAARKHLISVGSLLPACKNFLNGECRRSGTCKYRHVTHAEYEAEIRRALKVVPERERFENNAVFDQTLIRLANNETTNPQISIIANGGIRRNGALNFTEFSDYGPPEPKRRYLVPNNIEFLDANGFRIADSDLDSRSLHLKNYFNATQNPNSSISRDARIMLLEEENVLLHKQVTDLKKQVSDLTATNEFLLDQNAQFRVSNKRNQTNVTSVTVPAVTITNTTVPPNNTPSQPPQQVIRTVTASVATVPVSIATVTSGSPVSIAGVSMAPVQAMPAVSMAQPAAQQILAQSQQLLANPTSQLTLANSSQAQLAIAQQNLANNLAQQSQPITNQQLTSQAQQLALANSSQLTSQAQQLALAASAPQLITQQNLTTSQQMALSTTNQINAAINTSQAIALSNASQPMVSYPIMTQSVLQNALPH